MPGDMQLSRLEHSPEPLHTILTLSALACIHADVIILSITNPQMCIKTVSIESATVSFTRPHLV